MHEYQFSASKDRLGKIIEQYPIPMAITDTSGNIEYFNNKFTETFGYTIDDISTAEQWWTTIYPDKEYRKIVRLSWEKAKIKAENSGSQIESQEWDVTCKDGSIHHIEFDMTPITDGAVISMNDITETQHTIDVLRDSEELLSSLVEESPWDTQLFNADGVMIKANNAWIKLWNIKNPEEIIGKYNIFNDEQIISLGYNKLIKEVLTGKTITLPETVYDPETSGYSGRKRIVKTKIYPLKDRNNHVKNFVIVHMDITDNKKREEELRLAQKMDSIGRLAGGIAHDFNNMLGVILGYTEMAIKDVDSSLPLYKQLNAIHNAASRSTTLTKQLLGFASKQSVTPKIINLNDAIECTQRMLQQLLGENIDLEWLPEHKIWPIKMDPSQISQILANLCLNAKDAIADIGKVIIKTENITLDETYCAMHPKCTPGKYAMLIVSDNGCGIDEDNIDKIFEPFFTTKEVANSSGLGLSVTYGIIQQNNGIIDIQSKIGEGTTIKIYLPQHTTISEIIPEKEHENPLIKHGNETILLVDDEAVILKVTATMLKDNGYKVLTASTPEEAILIAKKELANIDVIITDVIMPEMNGRDLANKISAFIPGIKTIFMSGYTADVIAQHGVLDDGIHFIQKPFLSKPLSQKIREVLDGK